MKIRFPTAITSCPKLFLLPHGKLPPQHKGVGNSSRRMPVISSSLCFPFFGWGASGSVVASRFLLGPSFFSSAEAAMSRKPFSRVCLSHSWNLLPNSWWSCHVATILSGVFMLGRPSLVFLVDHARVVSSGLPGSADTRAAGSSCGASGEVPRTLQELFGKMCAQVVLLPLQLAFCLREA